MKLRHVALVFVVLEACSGTDESAPPSAATTSSGDAAADAPALGDAAVVDGAVTMNDGGAAESSTDAPGADVSYPDPIAGVSAVTMVKNGYGFTEGPLWRATTQDLIFSDINGDTIERFVPPSTFDTFRDPSGKSNGLAFDTQGRLIACEGGNRRVSRTLGNGTIETVMDAWQGKKLSSPNDVIVRSDGTIYFTDPDYSVNGTKELTFNGVYRVDSGGTAHLVADDLSKPNGIALAPGQDVLYVADEAAGFIRRYAVAADGSTSNPTKLTDVSHPDGITVDDAGNVYAAAQGGIDVFRADGSKVGSLPVPKRPTNCAFGGTDRKTLFITAQDTLYRVVLNVPGPP